jgi:ABC-type polysaccharide/polyol phosphate transport system ATPase subunit
MTVALEFNDVSKRYEGHYYRTLRDTLAHGGRLLLGRRNPEPELAHALEEVSFSVDVGESLAIIGPNGAGKTTALKLATRIIYPTKGQIRVRGRVSALIEVGTGMHPELTGRENIQLFGRILGFKPRDITSRFDEIVEFAGVEAALDRPVKYYSSGMQLRLGFSLAVHLEPDVFLVDEAIAVGDAGFQYRCVERMREIVKSGRTIVFVSHDMGAVETLCSRVILLERGRLVDDGPPRDVIRTYLAGVEQQRLAAVVEDESSGPLTVTDVTVHGPGGTIVEELRRGDPLTIRVHYRASEPVRRPIFSIGLGQGIVGCFSLATMLVDGGVPDLLDGSGTVDCTFAALPLASGMYDVFLSVRGEAGYGDLVDWGRRALFRIADDPERRSVDTIARAIADAPVELPHVWSVR